MIQSMDNNRDDSKKSKYNFMQNKNFYSNNYKIFNKSNPITSSCIKANFLLVCNKSIEICVIDLITKNKKSIPTKQYGE